MVVDSIVEVAEAVVASTEVVAVVAVDAVASEVSKDSQSCAHAKFCVLIFRWLQSRTS